MANGSDDSVASALQWALLLGGAALGVYLGSKLIFGELGKAIGANLNFVPTSKPGA